MIGKIKKLALASLLVGSATIFNPAMAATPVHNIVLVHGAWVNGSGWKPVYDILVKDGYHVSIAEHPLTSFNDDVTAVNRILAMQDGPTILVGHSYGGAIITDAGNDSHVVGLVYIAAHALDEGETEVGNGKRFPNATKAVKKTADGFLYLDPAHLSGRFRRGPAQGAGRIRGQCAGAHRRIGVQRAGRSARLENQAELVCGSDGRSHHQSRSRADVCQARTQPYDRGARREPLRV